MEPVRQRRLEVVGRRTMANDFRHCEHVVLVLPRKLGYRHGYCHLPNAHSANRDFEPTQGAETRPNPGLSDRSFVWDTALILNCC